MTDALEYYPTPSTAVRPILPHLPRAARVLDPACGVGELLREFPDAACVGIEVHKERASAARIRENVIYHADALTTVWPDADLIIANPPFTLGLAFAERALTLASPGTTIAMLLRLTFLESAERRAFHLQHPADVYVLAKRPSFRKKAGKDATDSVTCAWFVWGPGRGGRWSVL